jgi:hypothetical protein
MFWANLFLLKSSCVKEGSLFFLFSFDHPIYFLNRRFSSNRLDNSVRLEGNHPVADSHFFNIISEEVQTTMMLLYTFPVSFMLSKKSPASFNV